MQKKDGPQANIYHSPLHDKVHYSKPKKVTDFTNKKREARPGSAQEFSMFLTENTCHICYKDTLVNDN